VSWLAVNGWLVWRELLPRLLPGQPPPFAVELVEEAQTNRPATTWAVFLDGGPKEAARIKTQVAHPARGVFELVSRLTPSPPHSPVSAPGLLLPLGLLETTYRVNAEGELLGVRAHVEAHVGQHRDGTSYDIEGVVQDGRMTPGLTVTIPGSLLAGKKLSVRFDTLTDLRGSNLLLPLHPLHHVRGLRPGQAWDAHLLDPLAVVRLGPAGVLDTLTPAHAAVGAGSFSRGKQHDVPCWVIDYEGVDRTVRVWVRRKDDKVLCQEATLGKTRWAIYRD
jgi:hypothetical protein